MNTCLINIKNKLLTYSIENYANTTFHRSIITFPISQVQHALRLEYCSLWTLSTAIQNDLEL